MSFALPCLALPCLALPCLALPCLALPCLALPCLALPCLALPCLALPCLALPCLALPCLALPCLFMCQSTAGSFTDLVLLDNQLLKTMSHSRITGWSWTGIIGCCWLCSGVRPSLWEELWSMLCAVDISQAQRMLTIRPVLALLLSCLIWLQGCAESCCDKDQSSQSQRWLVQRPWGSMALSHPHAHLANTTEAYH